MPDENHVTDLLLAYALDALQPDEASRVAAHLAACSDCYRELLAYQKVADDLALAVPMRRPPPELKQRLMHQIRSSASPARSDSHLSWWQRIVQPRLVTPVWQALSVLVIIGLAISNLLLWQRVVQPPPTTPGLYTVRLAGTNVAPGASGVIIMSADGKRGMLIVNGLPNLGQEQVYQVWLKEGDQHTSAGTFSVSDMGDGWLEITSPDKLLNQYPNFIITAEPAGGSATPTGDPVLANKRL